MKILELSQQNSNHSIILKALAGEPEFRQLQGFIDHICMFATQTINQDVKITKTGARNHLAKWFLVPAKLRVQCDGQDYDYNNVKAGLVEHKDCVFFVYRVNKTTINEAKTQNDARPE